MNHCLLEVEVIKAPTLRYTQNNQTPVAEMEAKFEGLRMDDAHGEIKVVGWGNLAQDLQTRVEIGQRLLIEGRLRMNTNSRPDGSKEKRAEFTLSRLHPLSPKISQKATATTAQTVDSNKDKGSENINDGSWNTAPLVPDTDEIPF